MMQKSPPMRDSFNQRGAATLLISIFFLLAITVIIFFSANTSLLEQRISINDYRGKQAFEAAEAGLEYGVSILNKYTKANLYPVTAAANNTVISVDTDNDGTGDTSSFNPPTPLSNGASFELTFYYPLQSNTDLVRVKSDGFSDDSTAARAVDKDAKTSNEIEDNAFLDPFSLTLISVRKLLLFREKSPRVRRQTQL